MGVSNFQQEEKKDLDAVDRQKQWWKPLKKPNIFKYFFI